MRARLATIEDRARATLLQIKQEIIIAFDDELAFEMIILISDKHRQFYSIQHSRLGCGISRFYRGCRQ